jgi:uncharacterized membrane protein YccC
MKFREAIAPADNTRTQGLAGMFGALIGAGLVYWYLWGTHPDGQTIVLKVSAGALLGCVIGVALVTALFMRMSPKVEPDQDDTD